MSQEGMDSQLASETVCDMIGIADWLAVPVRVRKVMKECFIDPPESILMPQVFATVIEVTILPVVRTKMTEIRRVDFRGTEHIPPTDLAAVLSVMLVMSRSNRRVLFTFEKSEYVFCVRAGEFIDPIFLLDETQD